MQEAIRGNKTAGKAFAYNKPKVSESFRETLLAAFRSLEPVITVVSFYAVRKAAYPCGYGIKGSLLITAVYALIYVLFKSALNVPYQETSVYDECCAYSLTALLADTTAYLQLSLIEKHLLNPYPMLILAAYHMITALIWTAAAKRVYPFLEKPKQTAFIANITYAGLPDMPAGYEVWVKASEKSGFEAVKRVAWESDALIISETSQDFSSKLLSSIAGDRQRILFEGSVESVLMSAGSGLAAGATGVYIVSGKGMSVFSQAVKSTFDIICSALGLIVFSPVIAAAAIGIKLCDGGKVFYLQKRLTKGGKEFNIIKLRSMVENAEENGAVNSRGLDRRVTKVGLWLRRLRIDELPQFYNVLRGDMSLVGPRPERPEFFKDYCTEHPEFACRLAVKAGLTGLAQIYGTHSTGIKEKALLDLYYIKSMSPALDLKLLLKTVRIFFTLSGSE